MNELTLRVNGQNHKVAVDDPDTPLLYALRDDLRLRGPKFGCGLGQCGACTVLVDGEASRSCVTRALDVEGRQITTLEGLGSPDQPSRLPNSSGSPTKASPTDFTKNTPAGRWANE